MKKVMSMEQFMRTYFPKELEKRKAEGCCIYCGAPKSKAGRKWTRTPASSSLRPSTED